jgi:hypothetical protein
LLLDFYGVHFAFYLFAINLKLTRREEQEPVRDAVDPRGTTEEEDSI